MRSCLAYAFVLIISLVWYVTDSWVGSRAIASGLILGASVAMALSALYNSKAWNWAPVMLIFSTLGISAHEVHTELAELNEPQSTLGASGTDLLVLALLLLWLISFVGTITSCIISKRRPTPP